MFEINEDIKYGFYGTFIHDDKYEIGNDLWIKKNEKEIVKVKLVDKVTLTIDQINDEVVESFDNNDELTVSKYVQSIKNIYQNENINWSKQLFDICLFSCKNKKDYKLMLKNFEKIT